MEATEDEADKTWSHPEVDDGKIGPTFQPSVLPFVGGRTVRRGTVEGEEGAVLVPW